MNKRKKHICFFPGTLSLGGIGKLTINLAEEMVRKGVRVDFFLSKVEGEYINQIPDKVNVYEGRGSIKNSLTTFVNYLNEVQPDAVISARDYINIANIIGCFLSNKDIKAITSVHVDFSAVPEENKIQDFIRSFLTKSIGKLCYSYSSRIIAVSKGVALNHCNRMNLSQNQISVIYNPVYNRRKIEKERNTETHLWLKDKVMPVIIGVGRLNDQKNFELLINAFAKVREILECRLIILGEGPKRKDLEELCKSRGVSNYVSMPGFVDNPSEFLRNSDLFVMSSSWEGFGNVIVEALGVGTKVLSTDCPSGPAEILENGKYGKLVPVGDVDKMADSIKEELKRDISQKLLINRAKDFSIEKITQNYLDVIYEN